MCEENGLKVDMEGFEVCLKEQRERSRASGKKNTDSHLKFEAEATGWLQKQNIKVSLFIIMHNVANKL